MPTLNWDAIFDTISALRAERDIVFREATSYNLVSQMTTYASDITYSAKILWKTDEVVMMREHGQGHGGVWQETDRAQLVIWYKDLTGEKTSPSASSIESFRSKFKGMVNESEGEYYSRFVIDGEELKVRDVFPLERPDGKVYALRIILRASE